MKNIQILFLLALCFTTNLLLGNDHYEDRLYTVVAPSGLSLRSGPGLDYERVVVVPFDEQVKIDEEEGGLWSNDRYDTIDDREGYWLPVIYQKQKGFLFSGYLKEGHLFVPETAMNHTFRMVEPGLRCDPLNFDPEMHWYAFMFDAETQKLEILPTVPQVKLELEFETKDLEYMHAAQGDYLELDAGLDEQPMILLGAKNQMDVETLEKGTFHNSNDPWGWEEKNVVYPYQTYIIQQETGQKASYAIQGVEELSIAGDSPETRRIQRKYEMHMSIYNHEISTINLNLTDILSPEHLEYFDYDFAYDYTVFDHPRLFWNGDINGDGVLDFIFYRPNTSECCGGNIAWYLLTSEVEGNQVSYHKAAMDTVNACFGC